MIEFIFKVSLLILGLIVIRFGIIQIRKYKKGEIRSKNNIFNLINNENFLSNVISINLDGKEQKVLTRNISFDTVTDEPIHFDLMRIVKGGKIIAEGKPEEICKINESYTGKFLKPLLN